MKIIHEQRIPENGITYSKTGNISLNAGKLNQTPDRIQQKKEEGQKRAIKIVTDAFAGEQRLDAQVQEIRNDVRRAKEELHYMEELGITDEERAGELKAQIIGGNAADRQIGIERLKMRPIGDALDQAEDVMDATSHEIMSMIATDVRDQIEEEAEEAMEAAKERKEEKEAEEERLERIREKTEEPTTTEAQTAAGNTLQEGNINIKDVTEKAQHDVRKVIDELALIDEDIKGAAVDATR